MTATAAPARRFVLLETNGPWSSPDVLVSSGIRPDVAESIRHRSAAAGARVVLIRRPGRHPAAPGAARRYGVALLGRTGPGEAGTPGTVVWGEWTDDEELLTIDPARAAPEMLRWEHRDPPLLLVCCHGKHDPCCAVDGRPVAAALHDVAGDRADVWECSHLGGDRFAANVLALPSGLLHGGVTPELAGPLLEAVIAGRVLRPHFRGRFGDAHAAQAAQWHTMLALGADRPADVLVDSVRTVETAAPGARVVAHTRHGGHRYLVELEAEWSPARQLTCHGNPGARARTYRLLSLTRTGALRGRETAQSTGS